MTTSEDVVGWYEADVTKLLRRVTELERQLAARDAVIAQVREWDEWRTDDDSPVVSMPELETILDAAPESALAEVKAQALEEFADLQDSLMRAHDYAMNDDDWDEHRRFTASLRNGATHYRSRPMSSDEYTPARESPSQPGAPMTAADRDGLAKLLSVLLYDRGNDVREWPEEEAEAYREFRFAEGTANARRVMFDNAAAQILTSEWFTDHVEKVERAAAEKSLAIVERMGDRRVMEFGWYVPRPAPVSEVVEEIRATFALAPDRRG